MDKQLMALQRCEPDSKTDYEMDNGLVIPLAMGRILEKNNKTLLKEACGNIPGARVCGKRVKVEQASSTDVLCTEVLQQEMESVNLSIRLHESPDVRFYKFLDSGFVKMLENKFNMVIEPKTPRDSGSGALMCRDEVRDVFRDTHTQLEVDDKDQEFVMSYAMQNITEFRCDAIVNSTYADLNFRFGILAKAIGNAGGAKLRRECAKYIQESGNLKIGDVFVSGPGDLYVKHVFHVASPMWETEGGEHGTNKHLCSIVKKILQYADDLKLRKIALPAISAGGFGFPIEVSLMSIFSAVTEYFDERKKSGRRHVLRNVCLVDTNPNIAGVIKGTMEKCFGTKSVKSKEQKSGENNKTVNFVITSGKGCMTQIKQVAQILQARCSGVIGELQKVCPTWSSMHESEKYRLEELVENSTDYVQLSEMFCKTVENVKIVKIERVQNRELYREILDHREVLREEVGKWTEDMELKVWHGTSAESALSIKRDGFDRKYCGKELQSDYGRGLYFGHTAYVSNMYASGIIRRGADTDLMYMFRCTALLGNKHEANGRKMGESFQLPTGKHSVYWKRFEDKNIPLKEIHEIVIFRNTQVYPDYLITYKAK